MPRLDCHAADCGCDCDTDRCPFAPVVWVRMTTRGWYREPNSEDDRRELHAGDVVIYDVDYAEGLIGQGHAETYTIA